MTPDVIYAWSTSLILAIFAFATVYLVVAYTYEETAQEEYNYFRGVNVMTPDVIYAWSTSIIMASLAFATVYLVVAYCIWLTREIILS